MPRLFVFPSSFKSKARLWAFFILLLFLFGCFQQQKNENSEFTFTRFAMGTVVEYTIIAPNRNVARKAMLEAQKEVERVEKTFWEGNPKSDIYRFNHAEKGIKASDEILASLERAEKYYRSTNGKFDVCIKPVFDLYDFKAKIVPTDIELKNALQFSGKSTICYKIDSTNTKINLIKTLSKKSAITIGGIAKGYAVDRAVQILKKNGIRHAIINAGGDIYCMGTKNGEPWKIGIKHPRKPKEILEVIELSNQAVATSGDYYKFFFHDGKRIHHLINPQTGKPSYLSQSATVIANSAEEADSLATALFVAGKIEGMAWIEKMPNVIGLLIDEKGTVHRSQNFNQ